MPPRRLGLPTLRRGGALRRELVAFVAVALVVLFAVAAITILITEKLARDSARREAELTTSRMAELLVEPLLGNVLNGETEDQNDLDQILRIRMRDGSITEVFVWNEEGVMLYSPDRDRIGTKVQPTPELLAAIDGDVTSDIDDDSEVDDVDLHAEPQLEVYAPISAGGRDLAFEAYFSTAMIEQDAALLRQRTLPLALGTLVVLQVLQFPIAASMARRLSRQQAERTELVQRNLAASDRERRMIAADLHDGPVQDLAGVSYGLSALKPGLPERQQATVDRMVTATRRAVASLRRLMVDIYPPDLSGPGLPDAIKGLASELGEEKDLIVQVDAEPLPAMSSASAAIVYRTAKEALTNVAKHAEANTVLIRLREAELDGSPAVRLTVEDDGVGLPGEPDEEAPEIVERAESNGHFGLRLVRERITEAGGTFSLTNREEGGAALEAVLPVGDSVDDS
ncbi:sensor histidine kinase [Geodermatophilus sp. URMC 64]